MVGDLGKVSLLQTRLQVRKKTMPRYGLLAEAQPLNASRRLWSNPVSTHRDVPTIRHNVFPHVVRWPHHVDNGTTEHSTKADETIADKVEEYQETSLLPAVLALLLSVLVGNCLSVSRYTKHVPESATVLGVSILLGFFIRRAIHLNWINTEDLSILDARLLNGFFLPVLMFYGGWSVEIENFSSQFEYVSIFAIFGTFLTAALVSTMSCAAGRWGLHDITDWHQNAIFGALISATDPVATLASYVSLKIPQKQPLLSTLVVGEALMNDAVAITLFGVLNHQFVAQTPIFFEMAGLFFGSIALGVVSSFALVLLMRAARLPSRTKALTLYIGIGGYLVYILADTLELSGIIAGLFAGIVFRRYGAQHFSTDEGENRASDTFEVLSHLMETGVFVMCGISTALLKNLNGFYFGMCAVLLCIFSRFVVVIVCSLGCNVLKHLNDDRPSTITAQHQAMMILGCLRGGIALVLALEIGDWMPHNKKSVIIEGVFIVIVSLLLLCGGTTELALQALGLTDEAAHDRSDIPAHEQFHESANLCLLDDKHPDRATRVIGKRMDAWFNDLLVGSPGDARALRGREASI